MQHAVVMSVNQRRQLAVLDVRDRGFVVVEWRSGKHLEVAEVLQGDFAGIGSMRCTRARNGTEVSLYCHVAGCSLVDALTYSR